MIDVSILGATGIVGQRFVQLLNNHPQFRVVALFASSKRKGEKYKDTVNWRIEGDIPESAKNIKLRTLDDEVPTRVVFSALPSQIAFDIEDKLSKKGHFVFSNASSHRYDAFVPIIVPEVNPTHFVATKYQNRKGFIITNPNCSTAGLVIPLKAIKDQFGIEKVLVVTMQAISGAGFPGVPALSIYDNLIPHIEKEEEKLQLETRKILGNFADKFISANFDIESRCNRVAVRDGHTEVAFIKTKEKVTIQQIKDALAHFTALPQKYNLHTAPKKPIILREEVNRPQPLLDRNNGKGMSVTVGNIKQSKMFTVTLTLTFHNTIRGAAGGSILNAEFLYREGNLNV